MPEFDLKQKRPLVTGAGANRKLGDAVHQDYTTRLSVKSTPLLAEALIWLDRGVLLVPVQPRSKHLVKGFGAHLRKVTTPGEAFYWWGLHSNNIGLVTGGKAGLVVLDFDTPSDYYNWRAASGRLAETYTVVTQRGFHVYLWVGDVHSGRSGPIEVKGAGSIVLAVPSVHPSGLIYSTLVHDAPILQAGADFSLLSEKPIQPVKPQLSKTGDVLSRIKAAWPVLELAQSMTKLKSRGGRWYHGLCPFHSEHEPSFWVDVERGTFGCFACSVRGDVVNLYAKIHSLTLQDAIREMSRELPR